MPRKPARFYDSAAIEKLKSVSLSPKIKCACCTRWLGHTNFSSKQLNKARMAVQAGGHNARYNIRCQKCTGAPIVELECTACRKTKGLEEFTKSQRKKADEAVCFKCSLAKEEQDAIDEKVYDGDDRGKLFAPSETADGYTTDNVWCAVGGSKLSVSGEWEENNTKEDWDSGGGIVLSEDFQQKLSMSSANHGVLIETEYDRSSLVNSDIGWQSAAAASWRSPSGTPSMHSVNNPQKHSRSTPGSEHTYSSSRAERSDVEYKKGWAKIPAYDPKKDTTSTAAKPPEEDEEWSSSDSDSDENDDNDDYETI